MKPIFAGALALTTLAGCKTHVAADLFTSDILAASQGETLPVSMKLAIGLPSEDDCRTHRDAIGAAYATAFAKVEVGECTDIEYDQVLNLRVTTDLYPARHSIPTPTQPIALAAWPVEGEPAVAAMFIANNDAARALWDALPRDLTEFQTFKVEPILSAEVSNDLAGPVTLVVDAVFVDGNPMPAPMEISLERRETTELRLSDVANAALGAGIPAPVAMLMTDD